MDERDKLATNILTALYAAWAEQYGQTVESVTVRRRIIEEGTSNTNAGACAN